ncbi:MAG: hypothetical protein LBJ63_06130 [Prevotellaceae bacterium]|jgi:hypothetical protein|nr:hypothetical protein [Prevotellaceae bacterium]
MINRKMVNETTYSRHSDESQNPLNDEVAGLTRNDEKNNFKNINYYITFLIK